MWRRCPPPPPLCPTPTRWPTWPSCWTPWRTMTTCRTSGTTWKTRTNWTDKFKIALPLAGRKKQHTWPAQHPYPSVVLFLLEVMGVKKKEAVSYAVCYVLAAVLLAFYLITLYRGLHPNTSPGYEAYY